VSRQRTRANNKRRRVAMTILLLAVFCTPVFTAPKLTIRVTGKWQENLRAADLTGGAGTDFVSPFESAVNEVDITISNTSSDTAPWKVEVRRIDTNWDPYLLLYVKRTSGGTGTGTISNGSTYQEVTTTDTLFFSGTGDRSKIELQFLLEGVSAGVIDADDYITEVYYTVTEL